MVASKMDIPHWAALVKSDLEYDEKKGPRIIQAGATNGEMNVLDMSAFGSYDKEDFIIIRTGKAND